MVRDRGHVRAHFVLERAAIKFRGAAYLRSSFVDRKTQRSLVMIEEDGSSIIANVETAAQRLLDITTAVCGPLEKEHERDISQG